MSKSRPEQLELCCVQQPAIHLVSSEPALSAIGPTTPTIKLSPYEYGADQSQSPSPATVALSVLQSSNGMLGLAANNTGLTDSDINQSDYNEDLSCTTSEVPERLSVISSSTNGLSSPNKNLSTASSATSFYSDLLSVLPIKNRFATLSIADSLMPPEAIAFNSKRHHSLPIPGTVDYLSPVNAQKITPNGKTAVKSINCNGNSSQTNSPTRTQPPTSNGYSSTGEQSDGSCLSAYSQEEELLINSPKQHLQSIVKSVRDKIRKVGKNEVVPVNLLAPPQAAISTRKRLDSFASSAVDVADEIHFKGLDCCQGYKKFLDKSFFSSSVDPLGNKWLSWLFVVALAYVYNAIVIFLRCSFPVQTSSNVGIWFFFDYLCDAMYIVDILLRMRLIYFDHGLVVLEPHLMRAQYLRSTNSKFDLLSLIPLDLLYLLTGVTSTPAEQLSGAATKSILLRLPRLIKVHSYTEFVEKYENKTTSPNIFRVVQSVGYLLYMIHLNTCCYYVVSVWEGIDTNEWVFNGNGTAYIRCLYRATKTLITIGGLPEPETTFEIFFMNVDFLIGIFVFATIIGQMRDILGNAGATRGAFRERMDNTMALLTLWKIPKDIQNRVRLWYMYSWDRKELVDELEAIKGVPIRMQTDLAINVHMETLSKVSLFQDCDKMLLRDLVLKLRPVLYLPGDYICRKGEVGKEMFIIKSGCVQVVGGENNRTVLATLHSGSYFGEISLLSVGVGNRRTADVYSPGYANLFLLDKKTLQEVVVNYPDAQESLKKKAREILKKNQSSDAANKKTRGKSLIAESILSKKSGETNPSKFFSTVLAAARSQKISSTILKGSFRQCKSSENKMAIFSASDFSSDDDMFNNPPRKRRFKRQKKRRNKPVTQRMTNVDVHPGGSVSGVLSAMEKEAYDNNGYLSTDASVSAPEEKKSSTEDAIADILEQSAKADVDTGEVKKISKKPTLHKQVNIDETDVNDTNTLRSKPTPLRQFSFDEPDGSNEEGDKKTMLDNSKRFTFDELDEVSEEDGQDEVPPLRQFTFDEMEEIEDVAIPPLRQFTFDDSEDSDTEIEEHVRKMSKDAIVSSNTNLADTPTTKSKCDSILSKDDANDDEEKTHSKPKIDKAHAERIRLRQYRTKSSRGSLRGTKSSKSKRERLRWKGKSLERSKDEELADASSQDVSGSLSWESDLDQKTDGRQKEGQEKCSDVIRIDKDENTDRKTPPVVGPLRHLPPLSVDIRDEDNDENM